jgi:hypothetical protein
VSSTRKRKIQRDEPRTSAAGEFAQCEQQERGARHVREIPHVTEHRAPHEVRTEQHERREPIGIERGDAEITR